MKSPLVRLKIDKSCLTEWIDWSDTGTRGTGAIGHFDSGGLPWLINDRDESEAPLFVFSVHKCSCTSHTQDPPRCSWMSFLIEWNVLSLIQLKKKKKIPSVLQIWIKTRKDLQTHAVPLTTLYVLDDKPIILKACASICECDLHNFILMTYWFSWFSVKCYLSLTCAW